MHLSDVVLIVLLLLIVLLKKLTQLFPLLVQLLNAPHRCSLTHLGLPPLAFPLLANSPQHGLVVLGPFTLPPQLLLESLLLLLHGLDLPAHAIMVGTRLPPLPLQLVDELFDILLVDVTLPRQISDGLVSSVLLDLQPLQIVVALLEGALAVIELPVEVVVGVLQLFRLPAGYLSHLPAFALLILDLTAYLLQLLLVLLVLPLEVVVGPSDFLVTLLLLHQVALVFLVFPAGVLLDPHALPFLFLELNSEGLELFLVDVDTSFQLLVFPL